MVSSVITCSQKRKVPASLNSRDKCGTPVRNYNANGPGSVGDGRASNGKEPLLNQELMAELRHALDHETPPGGGLWTGKKVNRWMVERLGRKIGSTTPYKYLVRLDYNKKSPRPRAAQADPVVQAWVAANWKPDRHFSDELLCDLLEPYFMVMSSTLSPARLQPLIQQLHDANPDSLVGGLCKTWVALLGIVEDVEDAAHCGGSPGEVGAEALARFPPEERTSIEEKLLKITSARNRLAAS